MTIDYKDYYDFDGEYILSSTPVAYVTVVMGK